MRIAQITYSYKPIVGGADVYADMLRRLLEEAGHEVVIFQRPVDGVDDPQVRFIRSRLSELAGRRGEFWWLSCALPRLRKELAEFDVLIAHYPNYHQSIEWHPCTVLVSHGVFWDDRPGALRSRIKRKLARRAYQNATAVVANDTFFLREVGADAPPGMEPFTAIEPGRFFIPNCVDTELFKRGTPRGGLTGDPVILVPRNLYRNRGVHLAIEAFAQCDDRLGDARLVVAGADSDAGYAAECRELAAGRGLGERMVFFGPVPWAEMPAVYSAADLTVIPTLCGEGTSLAALESMSCGTATVSTNVAGLADLPTVQCGPTAEALAACMASAWEDREGIAKGQRETVRATFTLERWRAAWLEVLAEVGG